MKKKSIIRQKTIKIVNSRMKIDLIDNYLCEKDLQEELGASSRDVQAIISMVEKYFNIAFEDEEMEQINSVNNLIRLIDQKVPVELKKIVIEYN